MTEREPQSSALPLRALAQREGRFIGTAVSEPYLQADALYREILAREFNMITPENEMKWSLLRPARGQFDFKAADTIVDFAHAHGMAVRGHTLVWHTMLPEWLKALERERVEWAQLLEEHIWTVAQHFRGRVKAWDVVNEGIGDDCGLRKTPFLEALGLDYIDMAFRWAHEADPEAKLFYNDYSADEKNAKSNAIYRLVKGLIKRGTPIHGVGLQMHVDMSLPLKAKRVAANIKRFSKLGLEVHITEMDVRMKVPPTEEGLRKQADVYRAVGRLWRSFETCPALCLWGVTDRYSWVPDFFPDEGAPLLFDTEGLPKPAYHALHEAMSAPMAKGKLRLLKR